MSRGPSGTWNKAVPIQTFEGPWRGMDLRENDDVAGTYGLGINVDTSQGHIAARPGIRTVQAGTIPARARMHLVDRPGLPRYLLTAGPLDAADGSPINFRACNPDTLEPLAAFQDLTAAFGETANNLGDWTCSFVDGTLNATAGRPRLVTLLVTPINTYVYEPDVNPNVVRRAVIATDT